MKRQFRKPWFRAGRGWYATVNGHQLPLGVVGIEQIQEARDALAALLAKLPQPQVSDGAPPAWGERVESYLAFKQTRKLKPHTLKGYRRNLGIWLARFGTAPLSDVTREAVEGHALSFTTWGLNTQRNFLCDVQGFLQWCGLKVALEKPARESAGAECVFSEAIHWQAVGAARGDLKPLLRFLWYTGCRPSEATGLRLEGVDWESGTIRLKEHKTRGKGKDRILYLSPQALEVLTEQRDRHGSGLTFRNRFGVAWCNTALVKAMIRVSVKIGHRVTAYGYRHTYATRALAKGIPDTHVAALLGHGSTKMIHKHYSHLSANARLLKEVAAKVA